MTTAEKAPTLGPVARYEQEVVERIQDFNDPRQKWRRLFSEVGARFGDRRPSARPSGGLRTQFRLALLWHCSILSREGAVTNPRGRFNELPSTKQKEVCEMLDSVVDEFWERGGRWA